MWSRLHRKSSTDRGMGSGTWRAEGEFIDDLCKVNEFCAGETSLTHEFSTYAISPFSFNAVCVLKRR